MRRAVFVLALMLVAGCGGSEEGLSRDEYAAKADAVCAKSKERTKPYEQSARESRKALIKSLDEVHAIFGETIAELRELRPPESEQALANRWLASLEVLQDDLMRLKAEAQAQDDAGLSEVANESLAHNERTKELATQLGMRECNKD